MPAPHPWQLRTRALSLEHVRLMGILNVTPDSFSDGGQHATPQAAIDHALRLLEDGADILDIGGESTRPGTLAGTPDAIAAEEEQRRVLPVIAGILRARPDAILSVDTYRASTARAAVAAGAEIVNDVSGLLWDDDMAHTLADLRCGLVLMHTRGLPSQWATQAPLAEDAVLPLVMHGLSERLASAQRSGIDADHIALDPGFGFGKRGVENWSLLHGLSALHRLHRPLLIGLSRKGFLAQELNAAQRDVATHEANLQAVQQGASVLRVHDVAGARRRLQQASS